MPPTLRRRTALAAGAAAATAGLLGGARNAYANETVRFVYTNDTHARLEPFVDGAFRGGGVARRKVVLDQIRRLGGNVVLVDAGDVFQGTLYFNTWEGQADLFFNNRLGYELAAIGNHEFDRPNDVLARYIRGAAFPLISANMIVDPRSEIFGLVRPWHVRSLANGQVGFIGLTTTTTVEIAKPGPFVQFAPHYDALQRGADVLAASGVQLRVGLTHVGLSEDRLLAAATNGVQVIIGGHSHTLIDPTPVVAQDATGDPVLIVQSNCWGKYVGVLDVSFDSTGKVTGYRGGLIPVDQSLPEDPSYVEALRPWRAGLDALTGRVIGSLSVDLDGVTANVRSRETNLANLITDTMLERARPSRAVAALTNGGGIRASIRAGSVTVGSVMEVLPFGNQLSVVTVRGAGLLAALENGVSQVETGAGRFPQVSGIRYAFDRTLPAGSRIVRAALVQPDGSEQPLDPNASYRIATNDFMLTGGDGYTTLAAGTDKVDTGLILADLIIERFEAGGVNPRLDGRITEVSARASALRPGSPEADPARLTRISELWQPGDGLTPLASRGWAVA